MELFIFNQYEQPLAVLSEDTGLIDTHYRIEVNGLPDEPFTFTIESDHPYAKHVKEENKVVFKDHEGDWRLMTIKEVDDSNDSNGPITIATCEPTFAAELTDHMVVERRFVEQTADVALAAAVNGTRWQAAVEVELGRATTNFYYISSLEAIWKTIDTWGGELKDVVELDKDTNKIKSCYIKIIQRLGSEQGQRFEIDHNTTEIGRTVLSYPKTALYGRGSSLEIEDEDGEHTGGYTRYIDFGDIEWSVANGDPVDKPLGQKWVGDPDALDKYGILEDGVKRHRDGEFSNQDYEDPADLLQATWESLQDAKVPEVNYRLSVELFDKKVSLGDTCQAIDRKFARPIEIQARIIAMEYDLMDIEGTMVVEMGQFLDLGDDFNDLNKKIEDIKNNPPKQQITEGSYPDRKPSTPVNLEAYGGMEVIQLYWDYADELFIKHYEVYGSRTEDFVPDTQHLLWRGNVSAFKHLVSTDEVWYYRVRAVNYHGKPSDWSVQVRAATHRVLTEDIMWGPELAERMRELHRISDIIGENGIDFNQISEEAKDLINQQARIYTDEEIQATREDVLRDMSEIADDLEYIDGQLVDKVNIGDVYTISDIDGMFENVVSVTRYETDMNGVVQDLEHQSSLIMQNEEEILNRVRETTFNEETGYLRNSIADVVIQADRIEQTVSNINIGTTNLVTHNPNNWENGVIFTNGNTGYYTNALRMSGYGVIDPETEYTITNYTSNSTMLRWREYDENKTINQGEQLNIEPGQSITFTTSANGHYFRVYFNFASDVSPDIIGGEAKLKLEKGNKATDWSPYYADMDNRMTIAESNITQLDREIILKVNVDEIVSEINLMKEGIRLSGELIHLNGLSLIDEAIIQNVHIADGTIERAKLERAIIGTAQIDDLAVTSAKIASVNADKINAASLSAISANLGTITAGILQSNNNNIEFNLNNGRFDVYSSASIRFHGTGGGIKRVQDGWQAFVSYAVSQGHNTPMVSLGTVYGTDSVNVNDVDFRGIRIHPRNSDQYNNAVGSHFAFTENVNTLSTGGIVIKPGWDGSLRGIYPVNTGNYGYDLGAVINRWSNIYVDNVRAPIVHIRNPVGTGGYLFETQANSGSTIMTFRGINGGSWSYYLGASGSNAWSFGYINHLRPSGSSHSVGASGNSYNYVYGDTIIYNELSKSSLREYKENIKNLSIEDALEYVRTTDVMLFNYIGSDRQQVGIIHDDISMTNDYLVRASDDAVNQDNITYMIQAVVKDNLTRLDSHEDKLNQLKTENQLLKNEIKILKEKVA